MIDHWKWLVCVGVSVAVHFAIQSGLQQLPPWVEPRIPHKIEVRLVAPPPPPPEPEPEPVKPVPTPEPPKPVVHEVPRPHPVKAIEQPAVPQQAPVDHPPTTTNTTDTDGPTFNGGTLESTSQGGQGPAIPIGRPGGAGGPAGITPASIVKPGGTPVAAYEVTKMPLPQGRCDGKLPDDARQAGFEGTVVLELTVGADGRARDIKVVTGLGHGLTDAAITALRACHFSPGEKDGQPVAVRIREFKIRFVIQESN